MNMPHKWFPVTTPVLAAFALSTVALVGSAGTVSAIQLKGNGNERIITPSVRTTPGKSPVMNKQTLVGKTLPSSKPSILNKTLVGGKVKTTTTIQAVSSSEAPTPSVRDHRPGGNAHKPISEEQKKANIALSNPTPRTQAALLRSRATSLEVAVTGQEFRKLFEETKITLTKKYECKSHPYCYINFWVYDPGNPGQIIKGNDHYTKEFRLRIRPQDGYILPQDRKLIVNAMRNAWIDFNAKNGVHDHRTNSYGYDIIGDYNGGYNHY